MLSIWSRPKFLLYGKELSLHQTKSLLQTGGICTEQNKCYSNDDFGL